MIFRSLLAFVFVLACASCTPPPAAHAPDKDLGLRWVKHAAEYEALSRQAYHQAERALPGFIEDKTWSALPKQTDAHDLPPAIIFDVDETVITGVDFQLAVERPVNQVKLNKWNSEHSAQAVSGFTQFASAAYAAGVELFFVTNRPCVQVEGADGTCPYQATVLNDIREAGFETDLDHVMLANEKDGWTKEKLVRRELLARSHRIIMLFGDDLGDFIPCVRAKPAAPCAEPGTRESRRQKVAQYSGYWGNGWYILPNPMHGSWTSVR